mgnify:CR=1 FL=1
MAPATIHDLSTDLLELLCTHLTLADVANVACGTEWMRESADARVRELTELNQRKDEELAALKSALRRATEESAPATASASVGTSNEEHEREVKKLRDAKAWAEEECRAFEKECDEARDERDAMKEALEEAKRAREMAEKELETSVSYTHLTLPTKA